MSGGGLGTEIAHSKCANMCGAEGPTLGPETPCTRGLTTTILELSDVLVVGDESHATWVAHRIPEKKTTGDPGEG